MAAFFTTSSKDFILKDNARVSSDSASMFQLNLGLVSVLLKQIDGLNVLFEFMISGV